MLNILKPAILLFVVMIMVGGCNGTSQPTSDGQPATPAVSYDANSWKTMIPESCLSYFDGCNTCRRSAAGEMAACTRKACMEYRKPECLDDKQNP